MIKVNPTIDLSKLAKVGKWVPHAGAQDLVERVQRVLAGERFRLWKARRVPTRNCFG
jgi:hypothetical protein